MIHSLISNVKNHFVFPMAVFDENFSLVRARKKSNIHIYSIITIQTAYKIIKVSQKIQTFNDEQKHALYVEIVGCLITVSIKKSS